MPEKQASQLAILTGAARAGDPGQLLYAVIGLITASFVFAPECRLMTGIEPFAPAEIEKVIDLTCDFLGLPAMEKPAPAKRRKK